MRLIGDEGAVDRSEREPRQMVGVGALRIEPEDELHLDPKPVERHLAHPVDDSMDLALTGLNRLRGHHDEDAEKVRMALQGDRDGLDQGPQVVRLGADAAIDVRERLEESLRAPLHDREQDALLRAEVVVDRAGRDAGLVDERRNGRGLISLLGHQVLGGVEDRLSRADSAPVGGHLLDVGSHAPEG